MGKKKEKAACHVSVVELEHVEQGKKSEDDLTSPKKCFRQSVMTKKEQRVGKKISKNYLGICKSVLDGLQLEKKEQSNGKKNPKTTLQYLKSVLDSL